MLGTDDLDAGLFQRIVSFPGLSGCRRPGGMDDVTMMAKT
jgi:hypothetical protein